MIIDAAVPERHEVFSDKFSLRPWQAGLVCDICQWQPVIKGNLSTLNELGCLPLIKTINTGKVNGHTYLARVLSLSECPIRTKVYATSTLNFNEYKTINMLVVNKAWKQCFSRHEPVDILLEEGFTGYHGDPVELVVVDFANQPAKQFQRALEKLIGSLPESTMFLLLQPSTCFSRTDHQSETSPW